MWTLILVLLGSTTISGLSSTFFRIVGIPGSGTQLLHESNVRSVSRWTVNEGRLEPARSLDTGASSSSSSRCFRPTLDFLIKGGAPLYVLVGLQVAHMDGTDNRHSTFWSPVIASQWTTFRWAVEPDFRIVVYLGAADGTDDRIVFVSNERVHQILESLGNLLSQEDATALADGFHIVSLPAQLEWTILAPPLDVHKADLVLSCVATAERDARELLSLEIDLLEMTVTSILQVPLSRLS
jgi:hypothetical protein